MKVCKFSSRKMRIHILNKMLVSQIINCVIRLCSYHPYLFFPGFFRMYDIVIRSCCCCCCCCCIKIFNYKFNFNANFFASLVVKEKETIQLPIYYPNKKLKLKAKSSSFLLSASLMNLTKKAPMRTHEHILNIFFKC